MSSFRALRHRCALPEADGPANLVLPGAMGAGAGAGLEPISIAGLPGAGEFESECCAVQWAGRAVRWRLRLAGTSVDVPAARAGSAQKKRTQEKQLERIPILRRRNELQSMIPKSWQTFRKRSCDKTKGESAIDSIRDHRALKHDPEKLADFSDKIMRQNKERARLTQPETIALSSMIPKSWQTFRTRSCDKQREMERDRLALQGLRKTIAFPQPRERAGFEPTRA